MQYKSDELILKVYVIKGNTGKRYLKKKIITVCD